MDIINILSKADHTQLGQTATWEDIKKLIDEAIEYKTASVCIPASYIK
ncbi:2-deoxyribose-5-phosphate aldolase, partial [Rhodovulum adriaticum]|nr:2-deoxyribose-5-phosphate aldolase [Rhodovulum adriaticum]